MQTVKLPWLSSCLAVLSLLLASCAAPAAPSSTAPPEAPPAKAETPAVKPTSAPAAPSVTPKPAASASGGAKSGGVLNISHFTDPMSYDPIQESALDSIALVIPCYSGIVQHDPLQPTKIAGDLAETWDTSADGLSYTFHLYKNVKWHDGVPFTSEDARSSLETVRKPPRGVTSPRQEWLRAIDKIDAPDKDTLKITLQYPSASFLDNLGDGRMVIVPKHVYEAKGNMKRDVVGTGPYKFKAFTAGATWIVVKNSDYFIKDRPYLDGITWYIIPDTATRFAALRTRRVQVTPPNVWGLRPSQAELVRKELSDKITVNRISSLNFLALWMPYTKAPWSDVRVRRAVNLALDRPKVVKAGAEGVGEMGAFMPPGVWSLPDEELSKMPGYRQPKDADIAEAKRLLSEAGFPQGIKTTTMTRNNRTYEEPLLVVKDQLAQVGIDVTISLKDNVIVFDSLNKRNFETAFFTGSASYDDPDQIFGQQFVTGVPRNFSDFSDEQIDKWYDEQSRAMDPAKRKQIVLDMQRRMFELIPASMVYWIVFESGQWKDVKDLKPGIGIYNNLKFQNAWLGE